MPDLKIGQIVRWEYQPAGWSAQQISGRVISFDDTTVVAVDDTGLIVFVARSEVMPE